MCIFDNGYTYRIRKEEVGCSVFGPGVFIEGDDVLYDILKVIHDNGIEKGYENLLIIYDVEKGTLKNDLLEMAEGFKAQGIFSELADKITNFLRGDV